MPGISFEDRSIQHIPKKKILTFMQKARMVRANANGFAHGAKIGRLFGKWVDFKYGVARTGMPESRQRPEMAGDCAAKGKKQ